MAFLVDEQLALGALEALAAEAPDSVIAIGAKGFLDWGNGMLYIWGINNRILKDADLPD